MSANKESFWSEFKAFILKGNVVELATAVIIGGAFGNIVSSFVNDILMPPIGLLLGKVDFKELKYTLSEGVAAISENGKIIKEAIEPVSINYGMFVQNIINFLIIAFCIFLVIKAIQRMNISIASPAPGKTLDQELLTEIRDLLKNRPVQD